LVVPVVAVVVMRAFSILISIYADAFKYLCLLYYILIKKTFNFILIQY